MHPRLQALWDPQVLWYLQPLLWKGQWLGRSQSGAQSGIQASQTDTQQRHNIPGILGGMQHLWQLEHWDLLAAAKQEGKREGRPEGRGRPEDAVGVGASQTVAGAGLHWIVPEMEAGVARACGVGAPVLEQAAESSLQGEGEEIREEDPFLELRNKK